MRNNQDRFGAKKQATEAPVESPGLKFVRPTEFVTLPSGGSYPQGHPLHGQETIEIYYMTAKDEDILSSEELLKKGLAIERFMENIVVDKRIKPAAMYSGDRNAMIIAARSSGYGNAYETQVTCPNCQAKSKRVFDLDKPTIKESMESEEDNLVKTEDGCFETIMPVSKYRVKFRLLTGKDEIEMVSEKLAKKKTKIKGLSKTVTSHFKKIIVAVEGYEDLSIVNQFVDTMLSSDSFHLKKCYKIANPNVEIKNHFECESCGHEQELEVPLNADFFWPDS
jgi:hypothetical protein